MGLLDVDASDKTVCNNDIDKSNEIVGTKKGISFGKKKARERTMMIVRKSSVSEGVVISAAQTTSPSTMTSSSSSSSSIVGDGGGESQSSFMLHIKDANDVSNHQLKLTSNRSILPPPLPPLHRSNLLLSIYLLMRSCMMHHPYRGVYAIQLLQIRSSACASQQQQQLYVDEICHSSSSADQLFDVSQLVLSANQSLGGDAKDNNNNNNNHNNNNNNNSSSSARIDAIPLHMWIGPDSRHYIPIDRAIHVIQGVLGIASLAPTSLSAVYRRLEEVMVALNADGSIVPLNGKNQSVIMIMMIMMMMMMMMIIPL
jgi:hypothetical protein